MTYSEKIGGETPSSATLSIETVSPARVNKSEWHVCSLIVQLEPKELAAVAEVLSARPNTDVVGDKKEQGKLVVVMQADNADVLYANIESIRDIKGVLAVSLVYHQQDEQVEETP